MKEKNVTKKAGTTPAKTSVPTGTADLINFKLYPHLNFIKSGPLTEAEKLFLMIGKGREHAVLTNNTNVNNRVSREVRSFVSEANLRGMLIIREPGVGFYIPRSDRESEVAAARAYIAAEESRVTKLLKKTTAMETALAKLELAATK